MATDTTSSVADLLKTVYEPDELQTCFNEEVLGFQLATSQKRAFKGGTEAFGVQLTRTKGFGPREETGALPTPSGPTVDQATVPLRRYYQSFELSHDLIALSDTDEGAFKQALGFEVEAGLHRMKKGINVDFYGNTDGILATATAFSVTTITGGATSSVTVGTTRHLYPGDAIAFWTDNTTTSTVLANGGQGAAASNELVTVQSVTNETTFVVAHAGASTVTVTFAANNVIRLYLSKPTTANANVSVINGLQHFADDNTDSAATFCGIDRSAAAGAPWKGQRVNAAVSSTVNGVLTRDIIYRLDDKIQRACGDSPDTLIWDVTMRREYLNLVQPDTRFMPVKQLDAGYDDASLILTLGKGACRIYTDTDVPYGTIFMFPKKWLYWMELTPLEIASETGSPLRMGALSTGDVFNGFLRLKGNMATNRASAFGKIVNLAYTVE